MVAKNDITGDAIRSRKNSKSFEDNMDRIFGDKVKERERKQKEKDEYFARLKVETEDKLK
jgi:hypothetical protein